RPSLFFFDAPPPPQLSTLSLHDALPISREAGEVVGTATLRRVQIDGRDEVEVGYRVAAAWWGLGIATEMAAALVDVARERLGLRSEEHTSELQSPYDLVCRLLLEKKKKK